MKQKPDTPARRRIPELDGLRVLMIFIVSWYHIWQQSWLTTNIGGYSLDYLLRSGYVWVDGTVLLSSFLLFLPYAKAMADGTPAPDTRDFYFRRFKRIVPGFYFIVLLFFFGIALPWNLYRNNGPFMVKDLATHFTFTFPFFRDTYYGTPLGGAAWTLAIEVQAYALFPLIAKGTMKKPVTVLTTMMVICLGFRAWCIWALEDYGMVVNQLINFLDVYVFGILAAMAYIRLDRKRQALKAAAKAPAAAEPVTEAAKEADGLPETPAEPKAGWWKEQAAAVKAKRPSEWIWELVSTILFVLAVAWLLRLLRQQAYQGSYPKIQQRQMMFRPAYALCFTVMMLSAPFALLPLRKLLGNPVMKFLAAVSMNYYLIHQTLAVHLKDRLHLPASRAENPNYVYEQPWQTNYTLAAFGLSLLLAILITYGVEKPAGRLLEKRRQKKRLQKQPPAE